MLAAMVERTRHVRRIHAGGETFPLGPRVRAVAASRLLEDL
jgi:hypothetical protein